MSIEFWFVIGLMTAVGVAIGISAELRERRWRRELEAEEAAGRHAAE